MGSFSICHWLIVLAIVLVVFGTKKLGNIGKVLGAAVKGFKDGRKDGTAGDSTSDSAATPGQVANQAVADKSTIDVEARQKS